MLAEQLLAKALEVKRTMDRMILQDSFYLCLICGHETSNYNKVCENCEDPNGGDGEND